MQGKDPFRDRKLAQLAARQNGVVAYRQLVAIGLTPGAIEHRVRTGRLHRVFRGVYAVGHPAVSPEGLEMAAVLACGPGAVLSHWRAAARWRLMRRRPAVIDVVVPSDRKGHRGVQLHTVCDLHLDDHTRLDGIPITSVSRTLLDLAAVASTKQLTRMVNEADRLGKLNHGAVNQLLERNRGRRGTKRLRTVIDAVHPLTSRTLSDLEADFLKLLRKYKLPIPEANFEIEGYKVDFHWPGTNVIVELDSWEYHRTKGAFDEDRRRRADLAAKGYRVIPISDEWLNSDPAAVAATVRRALGV